MTAILTVTMNPAVDVSASTESVVPIHKLRCKDVRREPGGGGVNVARVVRRLGGDCRALYPIGGSPGRLLQLKFPAIDPGVTDRVWEISDLAEMIDATLPKPGRPVTYRKGNQRVMTDNHKVPGHRHSTGLILIVLAALLVGLFALGMLTFAPVSTLTMVLVTASGVVLIAFVVGIVVQEVRAHGAKRSN